MLGGNVLLIFSARSASAQKSEPNKAGPPKYDVHAEMKMKGTVEELKLPLKGSGKEVVHMLMKNGTDSLDISFQSRPLGILNWQSRNNLLQPWPSGIAAHRGWFDGDRTVQPEFKRRFRGDLNLLPFRCRLHPCPCARVPVWSWRH